MLLPLAVSIAIENADEIVNFTISPAFFVIIARYCRREQAPALH